MQDSMILNALQIVFLWHPCDEKEIKPLVDYCQTRLSPDSSQPFSHSIHLPIRFCTSLGDHIPKYIPDSTHARKTLVFVFVSDHIIVSQRLCKDLNWYEFIRNQVMGDENIQFIGIALSCNSYKLAPESNFIRLMDFQEDSEIKKIQLFISVVHQIYRYGLVAEPKKSLKFFLSHTKKDTFGIQLSEKIKSYLNMHSDMSEFYDVTSIEPGANFGEKIEEAIPGTSFIAIRTDHYTDSYWCQKEILMAKKHCCPMLEINALNQFEDRSFPFLQNIPVLRIMTEYIDEKKDIKELDILKILAAILVESVRYYLFIEQHKSESEGNQIVVARPPELADSLDQNGKIAYLYPYPDLYDEERDLLKKASLSVSTTYTSQNNFLKGKSVGISISDSLSKSMLEAGINKTIQQILMSEVAGFFIGHGTKLIYGGDLRDDGFTKYLRNEVMILQERLHIKKALCANYIAWPIYLNSNSANLAWRASCVNVLDLINQKPPEDIQETAGKFKKFFKPATPQHAYLWARSLTHMREIMIANCDIRISACGKCVNYSGRMPGVLEEVLIAIQQKKPIYLLGGFGGMTSKICQAIEWQAYKDSSKCPDYPCELTFSWQADHMLGYRDLKDEYEKYGQEFTPYSELNKILTFASLNNGLTPEENMQLFHAISFVEAVSLILKGIERVLV